AVHLTDRKEAELTGEFRIANFELRMTNSEFETRNSKLAISETSMTEESLAPVAPSRVFLAILLRDITVARRELPYFLLRTAPQQIGLMFSVILAPMIMFGCTYYPWTGLSRVPAMKWAVLINPLVYVSEAMRSALTPGVPHMPALAIVAALMAITAIFLFLGL